MADLFDNIIAWLLDRALGDESIESTVSELCTRLVDGGVPLARVSVGRTVLHPVIGLMDMAWDRETGKVETNALNRDVVRGMTEFNAPFGTMSRGETDRIFADLTDPADVARYPLFADLAEQGITAYFAAGRTYGHRQELFDTYGKSFRGGSVSFATKRFSGFSKTDIEGLERLVAPFCICLRIADDRFVANELIGTYLGRITGQQVLSGHIERGDGQQIDCGILYSDLRGSVDLSQELDTQAYLDTVNAYFDCVATAITEHGGEVLKFIGDGVLAIFPFEDVKRPRPNMCAAALASAQEAFARADHANKARLNNGLPPIQFGIGLHVGTVIYGNVGTARRLDFTATGPAVGLASRCEGMTRTLDTPLLATVAFADLCPTTGTEKGAHSMRGFNDPVELVSYPLA
ncbi:MAG: adenylate/guanylate cyclase domain-containing protein [Tateyamaria sp.]|uniref:adenylate/guanylate cyclase domain-containing protein n=2 Tax=Tateyamaria sp. TaxID=1929288 RepID=UPI00329E674D